MKILFICHRFPFPPQRGGKIRPFNIIKHLSETHDVTVASLVWSKEEEKEGVGLRNHCSKYIMEKTSLLKATFFVINNFITFNPLSMGYFFSSRLKRRVQQEISQRKFDLIMVHCSSVAQFAENVAGIPKLLDFGDMDSQKWLKYGQVRKFPFSLLFSTEGNRLQRAEKKLAKKFDICTCTTKAEMDTLNGYNLGVKTDWFPNGVDLNYFSPVNESYVPDTICFLGRMDYYPNQKCMIDFCNKILPLIKEIRPNAKLFIIGANPSFSIRKLGMFTGVTVTGSVTDVRPFVRKCAVSIAPLQIARGTQNKVLESLSMGVPAVISKSAAKGVDIIPDTHALVASTDKEFANAVIKLLTDHQERCRFSEKGRERMISHHNWARSMEKLDRIIDECMRT